MLKKEQGFTVIEVLMTLVLSAVVLTVGFQLLTIGNQLNSRTEVLLAANSTAFAKIQEYENKDFDSINASGDTTPFEIEDFSANLQTLSDGFIKEGTGKVYANYTPNSQSLIKLSVIIDYKYGSKFRKMEYGTYIQLGGVGR